MLLPCLGAVVLWRVGIVLGGGNSGYDYDTEGAKGGRQMSNTRDSTDDGYN